MTKRQRTIAEEDFPIFSPLPPESEAIQMARKRIAELELFIKLRKEHDRIKNTTSDNNR